MIRLALVGKNIQHSSSPEVYRRLLKQEIVYGLLDYSDEKLIPSAENLLSSYLGINITSPYKKHFLNQVQLTPIAKEVGAINCLKKMDGIIVGENTDYFAITDILSKWILQYQDLHVIILGDGVMSKVTAVALDKLQIKYRIISRKLIDNFDQINLQETFSSFFTTSAQSLVINTCSREFVFKGIIGENTIFWDYNYNFTPHSSLLANKVKQYLDGSEMLELQARYALAFWSLKLF